MQQALVVDVASGDELVDGVSRAFAGLTVGVKGVKTPVQRGIRILTPFTPPHSPLGD